MKRFLLSLLFCSVALAFARQTQQIPFTVVQADGTELTLVKVGDEHFHYFTTTDGVPMRLDRTTGQYVQIGQTEFEQMSARAEQRRRQSQPRRSRALLSEGSVPNRGGALSGNKKCLVILLNFADLQMTYQSSDFDNLFNLPGYSVNHHQGSVSDFFSGQSYGALHIGFDVVGPVTLSKGYAYYGENDENDDDMHPGTMAAEAVKLADPFVNFADYDWDGDGEVDQVFLIYAGYGEASDVSGNMPDIIWPHEWNLSEAAYYGDGPGALVLDDVTIDTYACGSELCGISGTMMDGIGTACHEFSHCLGIPDFYDTDGSIGGLGNGMGYWDVMDAGSYSGYSYNGELPTGYTSYERWFSGWLEPVELTEPGFYELPALVDTAMAYIIYNEGNRNEYYMLENRQNRSWHTYPEDAHGLLVLHVDYDETAWYENTVNNVSRHQRMTFIAADTYLSYNYPGDTYPGTTGKTELSNTSKPKATFFNANTDGQKLLNHVIDQITETDGIIRFRFDGGDTGLEAITCNEASADAPVYDLLGRPVSGNARGLTVSQGKIRFRK
ncbi:MAG: M6 family metalloprotease domain-containing protein [Bacteroidales bacterium]|nr:M6 family metalloprotease domain-containing protein [Bacteroidales bacterium]MBO7378830.1 M6 family metalloprotease domain-containing protein [Bacteroidales bacterium]